ncbi:NADH-quinone oxidoreductase subunit NuoG [Caldithrix abyssi]
MVKINIDGKVYEVEPKNNLLQTVLSLGLDLPYFCWHPAMGSVGSCRQCAVKKYADENDQKGRIVMACMEPVVDGMRISLNDPEVKKFRENIIELLMTNHPHDCPVCDEGGECHLQDMTLMSGHNYRRYEFNKRTHNNQYLGPFINHEMNRCIACYRCVRFYREYAGGRDFNVFASRNRVFFGRYEDGVLENEFSGNLVEVCPTGVFTDKTYKKHYTRKWDLTTAPSICHNCSLGCNIIAGERYGTVRRITSRYNGQVNGYFICDRGRFGYEYVNSDKRIKQPLRRGQASGELEAVDISTAFEFVKKIVNKKGRLLGIGSPKASLESNYALQKLVGKENFFAGVSQTEHRVTRKAINIMQNGPFNVPSLRETEKADVVLVLGEDVTNTAPLLALSLRQAARVRPMELPISMNIPTWHELAAMEIIQDELGPFFVLTPSETKLDDLATATYRNAPDNIARLGFAIAHEIDPSAPGVDDLSEEEAKLAKQIARELLNAKKPLIVSGVSLMNEKILEAAANIGRAINEKQKTADLFFALPEANSFGLAMLEEKALDDALQAVEAGKYDALFVLENDLYRRMEKERVDNLLSAAEKVVVLHYLPNETTQKAHLVVPVGPFTESDGTLINNEGRAQRFFQVFNPEQTIKESWRWLAGFMEDNGLIAEDELNNLDDVINALTAEYPQLQAVKEAAPDSRFRINGQKIPRQSHRFSGRTAINAHVDVSEPKPPQDEDSPLSFTMEGYQGPAPSAALSRFWYPGWNSNQAVNKFQVEVGGGLHGGDPGVRIFKAQLTNKTEYFKDVPAAFKAEKDQWLAVPIYLFYGSDELSRLTPGVEEVIPSPFILLNEKDAEALKSSRVKIHILNRTVELEVKTSPTFPQGMAGIPIGMPEIGFVNLPIMAKITG